jgi:hypothetical protein
LPKYYEFKVCGYYLYFTAKCIVEAFHVHASDSKLTEAGSAKFFVKENGDTEIRDKGMLSRIELGTIQRFIKENYKEMYKKWSALSDIGFFVGK